MGDIHCLYKIKVNSGMIFLKRVFTKEDRRRGKPRYVGEHIRGETFRQKD